MGTFIFNLNKNQKCKKLKSQDSIYCDYLDGPYTSYFGCSQKNSMKSIRYRNKIINSYYDNASNILPNAEKDKNYYLSETEVYKIIID